MIYLQLFLTFLKIGAVSFGGGYAMIPLMMEDILANGWMTEAEFMDIIAVSESTPGPVAVNMATFVGATQGGLPGSLLATLGVILPAFVIMLLIAALMRSVMKYSGVQAVLSGIRPCAVALILSAAITLGLSVLFGFKTFGGAFSFDIKALIILAVLLVTAFVWKRVRKKKPSPIIMILISAGLGMLMYGVL